jgi:molybdopterin molybdotransferase
MSSALPSYDEAAAMVSAYAAQLREAQLREAGQPVGCERVEIARAAGRVLAQTIVADSDQPPFARSTRDGFACRAAEASRHEWLDVAGATRAGEGPGEPLPVGAAWEIMTGAAVPAGADAVVMIEHVEQAGFGPTGLEQTGRDQSGGRVRLNPERKISAGENIVAQGAQAHAGDALLPAGTAVTFAQIALLASCGYGEVKVYPRPRVAILATGDELVAVDAVPGPGQIRNSNAPMLAALAAAAGGDPWILPAAADTAEALDRALDQVRSEPRNGAAQADLLLISGGVSAGKFDLVEPALARRGARFHFTGVRIQPGKPLVFGEMPRGGQSPRQMDAGSQTTSEQGTLPFFGLPGNPVSSAVTFLLFAAPVLAALRGSSEAAPRFALARLAGETDRRAKPGLTRFPPAACSFSATAGQLPEVDLVPWQGSGDLAALARSNCFLVIPEETGSLPAGETVRILLP